jgi:molybdopterin-guanine dinucleotide biosynthesis protein A
LAARGLSGVLLVGGASRRFGSPKALAKLDGETLAERAWRTLGLSCDERFAVGKTADALDLPIPIIDDGVEVRAPLAGVVAGLRSARHEICVVLPVDTPNLRAEHLLALADACADAAVPQTGPLPGAFRRASALPVFERRLVLGELALRDALAELEDVRVVELDPAVLTNVNEPGDLAALEITLVPYRAEHAEGFRSLVADTLREFGFEPDPEIDPDLADPGARYTALWIALVGDEVVGSVALRDLGRQKLELKRMYLRPEQRGRGLGRRLLVTALDWARANGAMLVKLDTSERMEAARALYEAYGFRRVPGKAPRQGQQRLLYELELKN